MSRQIETSMLKNLQFNFNFCFYLAVEQSGRGHLRGRVPRNGAQDEGDRCPQTSEDGERERRIPHHLLARNQHPPHLATPQRRHRQRNRRRLRHGQNIHR
jgi:hypothetical protein